jgi:hypothetical protein
VSPTFDVMKRRARSITPTFQPKHEKASPTSAKHIMLNNPCRICPATPLNNPPSLQNTNTVIAPIINVLVMSNIMETRAPTQSLPITFRLKQRMRPWRNGIFERTATTFKSRPTHCPIHARTQGLRLRSHRRKATQIKRSSP